MVNYIINDHFWRKNRSCDSKFTILKFPIFHHCISLVNGAPKLSDLEENLKNHEIQSFFATGFKRFRPSIFLSIPSTIDGTYKKNYLSHSDMSPWRYSTIKLAILEKSSKFDGFWCFFRVFPCWCSSMMDHNLVKSSR